MTKCLVAFYFPITIFKTQIISPQIEIIPIFCFCWKKDLMHFWKENKSTTVYRRNLMSLRFQSAWDKWWTWTPTTSCTHIRQYYISFILKNCWKISCFKTSSGHTGKIVLQEKKWDLCMPNFNLNCTIWCLQLSSPV